MPGKSRGASLITVLLVLTLLLVLALGLLTKMQLSRSVAQQESDISSVRNLALSGLEDFRAKIALDPDFPPSVEGDLALSYEESLTAADGRPLGRYEVTYSLKKRESHGVIIVTATGILGLSRTTLTAYLRDSAGLPWLGMVQGKPD